MCVTLWKRHSKRMLWLQIIWHWGLTVSNSHSGSLVSLPTLGSSLSVDSEHWALKKKHFIASENLGQWELQCIISWGEEYAESYFLCVFACVCIYTLGMFHVSVETLGQPWISIFRDLYLLVWDSLSSLCSQSCHVSSQALSLLSTQLWVTPDSACVLGTRSQVLTLPRPGLYRLSVILGLHHILLIGHLLIISKLDFQKLRPLYSHWNFMPSFWALKF